MPYNVSRSIQGGSSRNSFSIFMANMSEAKKHSNVRIQCLVLLIVSVSVFLGCQGLPDGSPGSFPAWARNGQFRFSRWDGGPIEVLKGKLSGWPGFVVPDPRVVFATEQLYDPRTIELLERAHINWIWVTWSVGFSNQTEHDQQDLLRNYIAECHRRGIHVTAYMSIANIFWEDMFARVPESKNWILIINGQPVPYPGADYESLGRVTRYMADLSLEAWQEYVLARVIAALEAGADGIMFDNSLSIYSRELLEQFTARALNIARTKNPLVLVSSNYHFDIAIAARTENAITSEDGLEPGLFDSEGPPPDRCNSAVYFVKVPEGFLALNAGLLRTLWAVSEGVRPVGVEYGNRHSGNRFLNTFSPTHQKLALAECAAFHAALEQFHESKTLSDLYFHEQTATENWRAVGEYNSFFQANDRFYVEPKSLAGVAVVIDSTAKDMVFLNTLAAKDLIFDVVYEQDATTDTLSHYSIVVGAPSVGLRATWKRYEDLDQRDIDAASPAILKGPDSVLMNVNGQLETSLELVHLLNYADQVAADLELKVRGRFSSAQLLSPDLPRRSLPIITEGNFTLIRIPELRIYDLLVLIPQTPRDRF